MPLNINHAALRSLQDAIDITQAPFSDRGSRLLLFKHVDNDRMYIKLAERLTAIQSGIDTYRFRPPIFKTFASLTRTACPWPIA